MYIRHYNSLTTRHAQHYLRFINRNGGNVWAAESRRKKLDASASNAEGTSGLIEATRCIAHRHAETKHGYLITHVSKGVMNVCSIHAENTYTIPRCLLVGYGREQIRRFVCYRCGEEFFQENHEDVIRLLLCEECLSLSDNCVVPVESDIKPYIKIVGWRQEVCAHKKRSTYNFVKVAKRDNYTCQYCGYSPRLFVDFLPMHVDHIIPHEFGGGNSMKNLVMACADCNLSLSCKVFKDFHAKKEYVVEWRKREGVPYTQKRWEEQARKI